MGWGKMANCGPIPLIISTKGPWSRALPARGGRQRAVLTGRVGGVLSSWEVDGLGPQSCL
jgi:hypothetical protein